MYRGKHNQSMPSFSNSLSAMNRTSIAESQTENLQKEVDNYTRMLEQEKRRFFRVQQNHREVLKDYKSKNGELESLKTKKFETEMCKLNVKAATLQNSMDKAIMAYNHALSKSNTLKNEINEMRKDKKNSQQIYQSLEQKVQQLRSQIEERKQEIESKQIHINEIKQKILEIKHENEDETEQYKGQIENIRKNYEKSRINERTMIAENAPKNQAIDNQPIVRLRLKNILLKNKEKVKIIDQYKKTMVIIQSAFEEMMEKSGINDLQQITKMILKQEDQETSIYHYINNLTKNLESMQKSNQELQQRIDRQQQINDGHRSLLTGTPEGQKRKRDHDYVRRGKQNKIDELNALLGSMQNQIFSIFEEFKVGRSQVNEDLEPLCQSNIESYLSIFEDCLQSALPAPRTSSVQGTSYQRPESNINNNERLLDQVKTYTKNAPIVQSEQLKQKVQQRIFQSEKLREFATDYWEKRREGGKNLRC